MILLEAKGFSGLEDARILANSWTESGGIFAYDVSNLHEDLGRITQSYYVSTTNYQGKPVYDSEFLVFCEGAEEASNFSWLPKELKTELWKIIFTIKRKFFEEYKPAEVYHLIKQPHTVAERLPIYRQNLTLIDYEILRSKQTITYVRTR